jgi:hypothetical protein
MSRSRSRRSAPSIAAAPSRSPVADTLLPLIAVAAACIVFRGALRYFFAQDDFTGLARARGLMPPIAFPWRWLSGQVYFDVMRAVAGLHPLPYRLASLAAHAGCVALVYRLCRRFVPAPAAAVGATFFGTHPALFTALYSISGIGEILAAGLGLGSLLLATRPGRRAWLALPLFAASLLSKESTLLLPIAAWMPGLGPRRANEPARPGAVVWAMTALSLAYLLVFVGRDVFGLRNELAASAPYALRFDRTLVDNLLTYLGWTARIALPSVTSFTDAVEPGVFGYGVALGLVWCAGLAVRGLRSRGWIEAGAWFGLTIVPVLPLAHHTYHYYLYTPLAGTAVAVAALVATAAAGIEAGGHTRISHGPLAAVMLGFGVNGALLVHKIETYPFVDPELRADATVDRARIAANVVGDLRDAELPAGTRLWFWSPASIGRQRDAGGDPHAESYWESNVRSALYDGLGVRVFFPAVASTRFVRAFESTGDSVRYAVYLPDGHIRVGTPAELDSVLRRNAAPEGGAR